MTSTSTKDHVESVLAVIRGSRRITVREVADEVGINIDFAIKFTEKLQKRRVSAKFVLNFLTYDQEVNRVEISQSQPAIARGNENFLKNIIKGDVIFLLCMMLKPSCSYYSVWRKGLLNQKMHR